jgi:hypothetical protein
MAAMPLLAMSSPMPTRAILNLFCMAFSLTLMELLTELSHPLFHFDRFPVAGIKITIPR